MTAEAALQYAAIELFVNRASSVRPGFRLSDGDAPLVSEICARLDGIPLAIELAAARMRMFSAAKLRDLLEERFRLLTGGSRDALPRQQTMRATIDWSFGLLSEHERILLRRLSVFSGGWTVEAAESVCADDVLPAAQIFELQSSLVDKSLVVAEYDRDEPRFHFLESTRAYALEKLVEGGERDRLLRRHCQWIAEFAERAYIRHWEVALARWSPLVEAEQDNICAALAWSIDERDDPLLGGSIAGALIAFWFRRPVVGLEGRRWIETALTLVDEDAHPFVAARLYFALALISAGDRSLKSARRALEMFERLGDSFHVAFSYRQLAMSQLQAGNAAEALDSIDRTIASFQKAGTTRSWPYAVATAIRASALAGLGRDDESRSAFSEALALFAAVGDEHRAAFQRQNLARLEYSCRNYDAALQELRKILQTLGESPYQGIVTLTRAAVAACYVALGRLTDALAEASDAIRLALRNQERRAVTAGIANVAAVAALKGRADEAAQLCGYCDTWYRSADVVCDSIERGTMATLHAALPRSEGDTRLQRFLNEGGLLSEEQAAEAALRVASRWP
jgi:tetratricopeptide (TPR) repeat protein